MLFITESGSVYEADLENKRVRRLEGSHEPTPRQGADGQWKEYQSISVPVVGRPVLLGWEYDEDTDILRGTRTSPVVEIR